VRMNSCEGLHIMLKQYTRPLCRKLLSAQE
jgi:hypothetical protein